jgi:hypothetical protein
LNFFEKTAKKNLKKMSENVDDNCIMTDRKIEIQEKEK